MGSIDSVALENEVFSKDPNEESAPTRKITEKQEEKKEVSYAQN